MKFINNFKKIGTKEHKKDLKIIFVILISYNKSQFGYLNHNVEVKIVIQNHQNAIKSDIFIVKTTNFRK